MAMKGRDGHRKRLGGLRTQAVKAGNRVVVVGADMIRAHMFQEISRGSVSGKGHVASRPGEFPNRDTGNLQAHLETTNPRPLLAEVRSEADYAAALEFKAEEDGGRPHMRPSRDAVAPAIHKLFAQEMGKAVKRSGK